MRDRYTLDFCEELPPYAFGESPFHLKGEFYRAVAKEASARRCPDGTPVVPKLSETVQKFLAQPFLASGWYDMLPMSYIYMEQARVMERDAADLIRERTNPAAKRALSGLYKLFLKAISAERALRGISVLGRHVYDFGDYEIKVTGNKSRWVQTGMPACMAQWYGITSEAYVRIALEHAGAKDVKSTWHVEPIADLHGVKSVRSVWDTSWS